MSTPPPPSPYERSQYGRQPQYGAYAPGEPSASPTAPQPPAPGPSGVTPMQSVDPYAYGLPPEKPKSRFGLAIAATVMFSPLCGIVAIVFASQVDTRWRRGDVEGARRASRAVLGWSLAAIGLTVMLVLLWVWLATIGAFDDPSGY